jgi:dienelactone hydrolase
VSGSVGVKSGRLLSILLLFVWTCSSPRAMAADTSGPAGTWYLNANSFHTTLTIFSPAVGSLTGSLVNERGITEAVDNISWDLGSRRLEFRRNGDGFWQWYRGTIVEGVLVGRFSHNQQSSAKPTLVNYTFHVTGWNSAYVGQGLVPRAYELLVNDNYRAVLRIDFSASTATGFVGRLKVYSTVAGNSAGEEPEYDVEVSQWDGTHLNFIRRDPNWTQTYTGTVAGRTISGTFTQTGTTGSFLWSGSRSQLLTYGFGVPKGPVGRIDWQDRTRRQLYHLMMADNPPPLSRTVTVPLSNLPPFPATPYPSERDDNPSQHGQDYRLTELQFDYTLPNPYGGASIPRHSHAYLAVPTTPPPPGGKYPAVLAVNGHGGSAAKLMRGTDELYWYGDAFARRGFVVLAVDISHRPRVDRRAPYMNDLLYPDPDTGDDPARGNGPHPAVKAAGFDSDWEEDGERAWDAMRGLDYLLEQNFVDASRVLVTGLSMGGEITTIAGALDPRLSLSIPAGFSPDLGVMVYNGNHPCWRWLHADLREYVDASDFYALTAPRPLVIETGKVDFTFSRFAAPFAADKQILRRARLAYGGEVSNVEHYLHYDQHRYHVGDVNPTHISETNVRVPEVVEPTATWSYAWQSDNRTFSLRGDLFDIVSFFLDIH